MSSEDADGRFHAWRFFAQFHAPLGGCHADNKRRCTVRCGSATPAPPGARPVLQSWPRNGARRPLELWSASRPRMMPPRPRAARSSGPSVRRSKNRQPLRWRNACISRFSAGCFKRAISRGALVIRPHVVEPRVQFKIAEMADGDDHVWQRRVAGGWRQPVNARKLHVRLQFLRGHGGGLDGAHIIFADAPEIFPREFLNFRRRFLLAETKRQILHGHAPVTGGQAKGEPAQAPAQPRHPPAAAAPGSPRPGQYKASASIKIRRRHPPANLVRSNGSRGTCQRGFI